MTFMMFLYMAIYIQTQYRMNKFKEWYRMHANLEKAKSYRKSKRLSFKYRKGDRNLGFQPVV